MRPVAAACLLLVLGGCQAPPGADVFPSDVYYRDPASGNVVRLAGSLPTMPVPPADFDIRPDLLVAGSNEGHLGLYTPGGEFRRLEVPGLGFIARPSFSPAGDRVVVQGSTDAQFSSPALGIYEVTLATGAFRLLANGPHPEESAVWSSQGLVAFTEFSPGGAGIVLHFYDPATGKDRALEGGSGANHLAFSRDGSKVLDVQRLLIRSVPDGNVTTDLMSAALAGLRRAGYEPDTRFPGQAGRGTFPLDGSFSADGDRITFDGAVVQNGEYGVVVASIALDGSDFRVLAGPFQVDPAASNNHNYSQLNPVWV